MTLTQYFVGAWVTASLYAAWEVTRPARAHDLLGQFCWMLVYSAAWPLVMLWLIGSMIRKAVLR